MHIRSLVLFMICLLATVSACTPLDSNPNTSIAGLAESASKKALAAASSDHSQHEKMAVFEGSVFVATTDLVTNLWIVAGWSISDQPLDTESQEVPNDCTLYPHSGVPSQWIGSCSGYILVPRAGATHIGVMVTNPDGSTTMFQIAPPPDALQN